MTTRRGFITGVAALFCAPAIVRASSLMLHSPVSGKSGLLFQGTEILFDDPGLEGTLAQQLSAITRRAFLPAIRLEIYDQNPMLSLLQQKPR